ncbi:hypothetical protein R3W88_014002 [Solanum pinnatisectum]|uniref:Uncharacterized protein n=1 Tax=Solanum pinnatisectum TaxID=50273 RepID=A0AAV9KQR1_9SOLN|nr:hypothetical protein R3W88_014002 [Solanum pinnatisectum]
MEKTSIVLLSLIALFVLLGSPSCMALQRQPQCQTSKDCNPTACGGESMHCVAGVCLCPPEIRKSVACSRDSDCVGKCPPQSIPSCFKGKCVCGTN